MYRAGSILVLSTKHESGLLRRDFTPVSDELNRRPYLQAMGEGLRISWCANTADFNRLMYGGVKPDAVFFTGRMDQYMDGTLITVGNPDDMERLVKLAGVKDYAKIEIDGV